MKNCILISSTNFKGFGLDNVRFLVEDIPYEYEVTSLTRHNIALLCNRGRYFKALNIAKKFGTLINRDLINE